MSVISLGGGASKSKSKSQYSENVFDPQAQALTGLYGNAAQLYGGQNFAPFMQMAQQLQPWMFQQAQNLQPAMQQQAQGGIRSPELEQQLAANMGAPSQMGQMYANIVGGQGNTYIDPLINNMRTDMLNTTNRQIGTQNDLNAAMVGQSGSAKHGVQNALTQRYANQDFQTSANAARAGAYDKDLQMKMAIAKNADTNRLQSAQQSMNYMQGLNQNQQGAFNLAGNMQNLGMGGFAPLMQAYQQPWNAMNQYAGIIGDPTVLGQGYSKGSSSAWNANGSFM
jgi:hypothetical protein